MAKNNKDIKRFKCMNFGACSKADSGEIIEINALETIGGIPDCPFCHQHTLEELIAKPFNWKPIAIAVAVVAIIAGCVIGGLHWKNSNQKKAIELARLDSIAKADSIAAVIEQAKADSIAKIEAAATALELAKKDSIERAHRDSIEKARQDSIAKISKPKTSSKSSPSTSSSKDLGYATFKGTWPNDFNGRMVFKTSHEIDSKDPKKRVAEAGDYIIGEWSEGHLVQGIWYGSDNQVKGSVIIGK